MKTLTQLPEWQALTQHQQTMAAESMLALFAKDPERTANLSLQVGELFLDYSKNRVTSETLQLFENLLNAIHFKEKTEDLFSGKPINFTEHRSVLHTALRNFKQQPVLVNDIDIMPDIAKTLAKIKHFSDQVRNQDWRGVTGKPIKHIVNIGIGGSNSGPLLTTQALNDFALPSLRCHFISKVDGVHVENVLKEIDPETSLFIISSKTFTTIETLTNAKTIRKWLEKKLGTSDLSAHFIAVTSAPQKAIEFGIDANNIFPMWDWVGGRYSAWSAIGLPLAILIGMDNFIDFLKGAEAMDTHFREAPLTQNMPVILAILGVWYINFFQATTQAIIPYSQHLDFLRVYLQQLDMESNGKRVNQHGEFIDYLTGPVLWGEHGSDGQHAFHQLLHQGTHLIPVDFILVGQVANEFHEQQDILIASALSQAKALLQGKTSAQALAELELQGYTGSDIKQLANHKSLPGNRPSNTLFIKTMTPFNLGALLALYEHKVFTQGIIWNINSFDQWGVELGKQLLPQILNDVINSASSKEHDASTLHLIQHYKNLRKKSC
jgi:glucose-6-phosphate isomerase